MRALRLSLFIALPPRFLFPVVSEKRGAGGLRGRHSAVLKEDVQAASLLLPLQRRAHYHQEEEVRARRALPVKAPPS